MAASRTLSPAAAPLLRVKDLVTEFPMPGSGSAAFRAVNRVSFQLSAGSTLGIVGESGSGKTTLARTILRLIPAASGCVEFDGTDLLTLDGRPLRRMRRRMQIVFQDPAESLNPRMNVGSILGEPLAVHGLVRSAAARRARVAELLGRVGLTVADARRYPHELSGGQRQRIGIARALALEPELIVCDEPVSALDVSIQAQILNLLSDLQRDLGLAFLFIAHDLAVVRRFCDEVAVMYFGRIVEHAPSQELFAAPRHPYTQALLAATPIPDPRRRREWQVPTGEPPNPLRPPTGCAYQARCGARIDRCGRERPELLQLSSGGSHRVACHEVANGEGRMTNDE